MNSVLNKKLVAINSLSTVFQVVFTGITYFFIYKILLEKVGASLLGVWSIVIVTTSLANLGNLGIGSGLVKFISELTSVNDKKDLEKLIYTALLSSLILYVFFSLLLLIFSKPILQKAIDLRYLNIAIKLLPYSLFSLFINGCGSVFVSVLEGYEKNYIKNIILILGNILLLILTFRLINDKGIFSIAYAQNVQVMFVLICNFIYASYLIGFSFYRKWNWDKAAFKKISVFGLKFQLVSITQMLYEPTTKLLLGKYSSLSTVGYYEMATRLVSQIRATISNANQVIVPIISRLNKYNYDAIASIYSKSLSIITLISFILFTGILIFSISISEIWIGTYNEVFVFSILILSVSIFINLLSGPAYFNLIGKGQINYIVFIHIIIGISNLLLGILLSNFFPEFGVIIGWGVSLALGSLMLIYFYHKKMSIPTTTILKKNISILIITLFLLFVIMLLFNKFIFSIFTFTQLIIVCFICFTIVSCIGFYVNRTLINYIKNIFLKQTIQEIEHI